MAQLFRNSLYDDFGRWPLAYIPYGGADFGEIGAAAVAVGDGDGDAFSKAWTTFADRVSEEAEVALSKGHHPSARELFLRAIRSAHSLHRSWRLSTAPRRCCDFPRQRVRLITARCRTVLY